MTPNALFAFLHFAAVFGIVGTLVYQWISLSPAPTLDVARRIQLTDRWYGICAGVVLVAGLLRVYRYEKGHAFYAANAAYHAKLGLFIVIGLLSIYPTLQYLKWRRQTRVNQPPVLDAATYRRILWVLRIELLGLLAMALCATLMARGIGSHAAS